MVQLLCQSASYFSWRRHERCIFSSHRRGERIREEHFASNPERLASDRRGGEVAPIVVIGAEGEDSFSLGGETHIGDDDGEDAFLGQHQRKAERDDMDAGKARGYDDFYGEFDSPLMRQLRLEGYGRDIGQHSWVNAEEVEEDIPRLELTRSSRLLDLGCGPGGPLAFIAGLVGCHGSGMDLSAKAIAAARARVASLGLDGLVTLLEADLNEPIPFASGSFDAVMSLDAILHFRDRLSVFREVARALIPAGRFLFTDAGVITGAISDEEIRLRATHGYTQFVPPDFNEHTLELAGFRLIDRKDRTGSLLKTATGRLTARLSHQAELEQLEGSNYFERQQRYLETVLGLAQRGALSRIMYVAESRAV